MGEASVPPPVVISPPDDMRVSSAPRSARGLRQKVVDELKSVRGRRSPAVERHAAKAPPPLELNEEDEDEEAPDTPVHASKKGCSICERSFTVFRAKHTCKLCAQKICDDCSKNRMKLHRRLERKKGSRLCDPCAKSYLQSEDALGALPDHPPALSAAHSEYTLLHKEDKGLSRRHSVPAKTLSSLLHAKEKNVETVQKPVSVKAKAVHKPVHVSHLRTRHWVSLTVVAVLVALRVFYYHRRGVEGNALTSIGASSAVIVSPPYTFMERALDNVLCMRTLGTYLLGLVLFDELKRPKSSRIAKPKTKHHRRRRSHRKSTAERERTKSSLSDSSVASKRQESAPPSPHTSQEDDLEVDTGDTEGNHEEGFTLEKLLASLEDGATVRAPDGELQLGKFMATCNVICSFLGVFGRATSFAGSTVGGYFTSIEHNLEAWPAPSSSNTWKEQSVIAVIEREVEMQVANVGGKKKPSCSRCLLRLLWFIEFVEACVRLTLLETTEDNCYAGASKAYEETLGKRHPWLVRKGVNTALSSIPTRSHILNELHLSDETDLEPLRTAHVKLKTIVSELEGVFAKHGLQDLK